MLEIGSVIGGKYRILAEIGHGGMSTVYLALNEKANKQWAVKEVRTEGGNANDANVIRQNLIAETFVSIFIRKKFFHITHIKIGYSPIINKTQ